MSAIIHLMGRVTKDPAMQQGRNNGTEYISLDLATSQRSQNAQNMDPESWYSLIGKPLLTELIGDLQARGHQKLYINEAGEIFIYANNTPEIKDTFQHFPPRDYWAALTDIFTRDELKAKETENTLELSWV